MGILMKSVLPEKKFFKPKPVGKSKTCENCKDWVLGNTFRRICTNKHIHQGVFIFDRGIKEQIVSPSVIITEKNFGCIHFKKREPQKVIKIKNI